MHLLRLIPILIITSFVCSCNTADDKKEESTQTATDTTVAMNTTANEQHSTIVTTPMNMMIVRHKVSDYQKWKLSFDEPKHDSLRASGGMHPHMIGRSKDDSNMLVVAVRADDMEKAKMFGKSADLQRAMKEGGVIGKPNVMLVTVTYMDTAQMNSDMRSMVVLNVKDWANWEKEFANGAQERMENGIVTRAYGHDADNDKRVVIVTALTDTTKAMAYWKSDMLKKRREASGVTQEVERFNYRMVQRY